MDSGLDQFSDADIATFAAAGDAASQALSGTAYYDNVLVREGPCPIPEPATHALALAALTAIVVLRRRAGGR